MTSKHAAEITVTGDKEVAKVLRELGATHGKSVERRLARLALGAGLTPLAQRIRKGAPPRTRIRKAIGKRNKRNRRKGIHEAKAGINVGSKAGKAPHGAWFAAGTADRTTKKGQNRGRMLGDNFVVRATKEARPRVQQAMLYRIRQRLPSVIQQVAKKYATGTNQPTIPTDTGPSPDGVPF